MPQSQKRKNAAAATILIVLYQFDDELSSLNSVLLSPMMLASEGDALDEDFSSGNWTPIAAALCSVPLILGLVRLIRQLIIEYLFRTGSFLIPKTFINLGSHLQETTVLIAGVVLAACILLLLIIFLWVRCTFPRPVQVSTFKKRLNDIYLKKTTALTELIFFLNVLINILSLKWSRELLDFSTLLPMAAVAVSGSSGLRCKLSNNPVLIFASSSIAEKTPPQKHLVNKHLRDLISKYSQISTSFR